MHCVFVNFCCYHITCIVCAFDEKVKSVHDPLPYFICTHGQRWNNWYNYLVVLIIVDRAIRTFCSASISYNLLWIWQVLSANWYQFIITFNSIILVLTLKLIKTKLFVVYDFVLTWITILLLICLQNVNYTYCQKLSSANRVSFQCFTLINWKRQYRLQRKIWCNKLFPTSLPPIFLSDSPACTTWKA